MEVKRNELVELYSQSSDDDLIELYFSGGLTEEAYDCLVSELVSRDIGHYQLYQLSDLSDLQNKKDELHKSMLKLKAELKVLNAEVEKVKKPKKKGMFGLILERKKLEEEERIRQLKKLGAE